MSQEKLAGTIGIAPQQVQKYEVGTNRVAAGRLWGMAKILEVDVGYFFEGLKKRAKRKAKPRINRSQGQANKTPQAAKQKAPLESDALRGFALPVRGVSARSP